MATVGPFLAGNLAHTVAGLAEKMIGLCGFVEFAAEAVVGLLRCRNAMQCSTMHFMDAQLTVRLPSELSDALVRASRKSGRKSSEIVRSALREYLNTPVAAGPRPAERVRGLIGSLDSGITDLAEQHRTYVIESLTRGK